MSRPNSNLALNKPNPVKCGLGEVRFLRGAGPTQTFAYKETWVFSARQAQPKPLPIRDVGFFSEAIFLERNARCLRTSVVLFFKRVRDVPGGVLKGQRPLIPGPVRGRAVVGGDPVRRTRPNTNPNPNLYLQAVPDQFWCS